MINLSKHQEALVTEMLDQGWFFQVVRHVKDWANCSYKEALKWVEERAW